MAGNSEKMGTVVALTDQRVLAAQGAMLTTDLPRPEVGDPTVQRGAVYSSLRLAVLGVVACMESTYKRSTSQSPKKLGLRPLRGTQAGRCSPQPA